MILVGNGKLFTRNSSNRYYENGGVVIDGQTIKKVGDYNSLRQEFPEAELIDAGGNLIMPAFVNTHEHIYSAMARGFSIKGYQPNGFLEILDGMWWTVDKNLTLAQIKDSATATYMECIRNGVTTVFDHHASFGAIGDSLFTINQVAQNAGIRNCLCYEVSDRAGEDKMREGVHENERFINYALKDDSDMVAGMMGLHASFTIAPETMEYVRQHKPKAAGYHVHVAEGIEDLHDSLKKYNKRIVERWMDEEVLGDKTIAVHCIYVNKNEMKLLHDTNTIVVHNPESNMGNACGCPPTMEIYKAGILTGLGTDGYTHDVLESYKVANVLHKHNLCNPNAAWGELPDMLFNNNAIIANRFFKRKLGVLEEGAAADVIISEYKPYTPIDETNLNGHILFGMTGKDVVTTIANGKVLMKDRMLITIDEEKELASIRKTSAQLWQQING